jgi:hypothetical protein
MMSIRDGRGSTVVPDDRDHRTGVDDAAAAGDPEAPGDVGESSD